jgi:predicted Zn-ribbon and HTH transcriptional regulator
MTEAQATEKARGIVPAKVSPRETLTTAAEIEALKAERQEWINEEIKDTLALIEKGGTTCSRGIPFIVCDTCGAEFQVTIRSDTKYCPACRSATVRPLRPEEGTIGRRIVDVTYVAKKPKKRKKKEEVPPEHTTEAADEEPAKPVAEMTDDEWAKQFAEMKSGLKKIQEEPQEGQACTMAGPFRCGSCNCWFVMDEAGFFPNYCPKCGEKENIARDV